MNKKYCMDCGHYIPGGREQNCSYAVKVNDKSVCALKEACEAFIERQEKENVVFNPIRMRKPRKRRVY